MNFLYPIYTEQTECQDCYKCVRQCPNKAIRVENGHAMVMPELCILCGNCVTNCPAKAKHVRNDLAKTRQLFTLRKNVIVSLAPSFVSEFSEFTPEQLIAALKKIGFNAVSETAIGADFVSMQVADVLENAVKESGGKKLFLSSACPSVVEYIKFKMPEFSPYITDIASPLLAHARYLKKTYGYDNGVVFIGPCIAKKREADVWDEIDASITFCNLRKWFEAENITPQTITVTDEDCFIPQRASKGVLYPSDGGMIEAVKKYNKTDDVQMIAVSGIDQIADVLKGIEPEKLKKPLFIEFLACNGGCINGPAARKQTAMALKHVAVMDYAENVQNTISQNVRDNLPQLSGILPVEVRESDIHTETEIRAALHSVGKYSHEDELNCACCGYDTCRHFAAAMLDKHAEKTMCLSYMRKLAQKKANGLIQAIPSGAVIADKNLSIVECNKNFAKLMGREIEEMYNDLPGLEGADLSKITRLFTFFADVLDKNGPDVIERDVKENNKIFHITVFSIEKEGIAGGVIEDVTVPQVRRNRIMSQAKKVIDKNLSVVQKIAYLLGENAAETESILNSIIESFSGGENSSEKGR